MIKRYLTDRILNLLKYFPSVAILGARQVGKTTLVNSLIPLIKKESLYFDLELPADTNRLLNPQMLFEEYKDHCIIIDEVQRMPELFPVLRAMIDRHRVAGRFILLGSASPGILRGSSESLAGRIVYTELSPFIVPEINAFSTSNELWLNGGFPEPFLSVNSEKRTEWLNSFVRTYIERELPNLGLKANSILMNRFFGMLSLSHGHILNMSTLSRSLGVSIPTISKYLDFLEQSYFIRRLPPFYVNLRKRLVKSPKVYIRDSGILHHLLGIPDMNALLGHPLAGNSWEGYVIQQLMAFLGDNYDFSFYRTQDGTECDLIISKGINVLSCIEIKLTEKPKITKSLTLSIQDLKPESTFIVIPLCNTSYKIGKGITVCNLNDLFKIFKPG